MQSVNFHHIMSLPMVTYRDVGSYPFPTLYFQRRKYWKNGNSGVLVKHFFIKEFLFFRCHPDLRGALPTAEGRILEEDLESKEDLPRKRDRLEDKRSTQWQVILLFSWLYEKVVKSCRILSKDFSIYSVTSFLSTLPSTLCGVPTYNLNQFLFLQSIEWNVFSYTPSTQSV